MAHQAPSNLISVVCKHCRFRFKVEAKFAGKEGTCPNAKCGRTFIVAAAKVPTRESSTRRKRTSAASTTTTARKRQSSESFDLDAKDVSTRQRRKQQTERPTGKSQQYEVTVRQRKGTAPARTTTHGANKLKVGGAFGAALVLLLGVSFFWPEPGQPMATADSQVVAAETKKAPVVAFKSHIAPFMKKYCYECHGPDETQAGLGFQKYKTEADMLDDRKKWEKVLSMLEIGAMPPSEMDVQPNPDERKVVVNWIEDKLFNIDCTIERNPGRVTIRRLNRAEYNNTIRDLLGVKFRPADDFPSDDVGYGFDNIGDVLSISPLLMEKYLDAAEQISEKAIVAIDPSKTVVQYEGNKLKATGGVRLGDQGFYAMYSRAEVTASHEFPSTGEYILRARAGADQAGGEVAKMEFRLDGKPLKVFEVKGQRKPEVYEMKTKVKAGSHRFSAAFINDYYNPKAKNPKDRDRNMYVRFLEVKGPTDFDPNSLPEEHRRIITVRPDKDRSVADAAREVLGQFVSRAFRRPASDEEVGRLADLVEFAVKEGETFEAGIQFALQAILVSPHFLFRVELHPTPENAGDNNAVADFELASRLSYFLWSSMPDDELIDLAKKNELHNPSILDKQVRRMLTDEKSRALVDNFAVQWLNLQMLDEVQPDTDIFPEFTPELRQDMVRETKMFFESVMQDNRTILDFLDGKYSFVNERLARHYNIPDVRGDEFQLVSFDNGRRMGLLTQASILTLTSDPNRTSPVKRGKWIMENILGTPPPDPPPDVPLLEETAKAAPGKSMREQLELHRKDPGCAVCHRQMDEIGFGFENFDAVGKWRDKDGELPVDSSGTLPSNETFNDAGQLVKILKKRESQFCRCLAEKMLTYAVGRGLEYYDKCAIDKIEKALQDDNYRFSTLVTEIVKSEPFLMRRGEK